MLLPVFPGLGREHPSRWGAVGQTLPGQGRAVRSEQQRYLLPPQHRRFPNPGPGLCPLLLLSQAPRPTLGRNIWHICMHCRDGWQRGAGSLLLAPTAAAQGPGRRQQRMQTKIRCKQNATHKPCCRQTGLGAAWGGETRGKGRNGVLSTQLCTQSSGAGARGKHFSLRGAGCSMQMGEITPGRAASGVTMPRWQLKAHERGEAPGRKRRRGAGPAERGEGLGEQISKLSRRFPSRRAGDQLPGPLLPRRGGIPARRASSRGCLHFSS